MRTKLARLAGSTRVKERRSELSRALLLLEQLALARAEGSDFFLI